MRRSASSSVIVVVGAAVLALLGATSAHATPAPAPTTQPAPTTGVIVAHLAPVAGTPDLAGVGITLTGVDGTVRTATTDAAGQVTFSGLTIGNNGYYAVEVTSTPTAGTSTYADVEIDGITPTTTPTTVRLPYAIGGTITGRLVDHTGAPIAGTVVHAVPLDHLPALTATTDADGIWTLHGTSGVYDFWTLATGSIHTTNAQQFRATWEGRGTAQTATSPATTSTLPTKLVHSAYDLDATIATDRTYLPIAGATVRATNTATGATFDERTSFTVTGMHEVQWEIPTGSYTIQLVTTATPGHPVETWWVESAKHLLTQDASKAGVFRVEVPDFTGVIARIPR